MKNEWAVNEIENFCREYEYDIYKGYSGRGMYGKKCVGIETGDPLSTLMEVVDYMWLGNDERIVDNDGVQNIIGEPRVDNLGMSRILYFPFLECVEDER